MKDEWVKTREAAELWAVERELAIVRRRDGQDAGRAKRRGEPVGGNSATNQKTRDAVASHLGESPKTAELRVKLAAEAAKQNPENPEESPIATAC